MRHSDIEGKYNVEESKIIETGKKDYFSLVAGYCTVGAPGLYIHPSCLG